MAIYEFMQAVKRKGVTWQMLKDLEADFNIFLCCGQIHKQSRQFFPEFWRNFDLARDQKDQIRTALGRKMRARRAKERCLCRFAELHITHNQPREPQGRFIVALSDGLVHHRAQVSVDGSQKGHNLRIVLIVREEFQSNFFGLFDVLAPKCGLRSPQLCPIIDFVSHTSFQISEARVYSAGHQNVALLIPTGHTEGSSLMIIIAEAGVNHNGNPDLALELVRASASAGADIVKFQTFKTDRLVTREANQANYQKRNLGAPEGQSQSDMLRKLELGYDVFFEIKKECVRNGIRFLSTPFDIESALFLIDELGEDLLKVGSGDFDNLPLLIAVARRGAKVILSTGMTTLGDIEISLGALAFGYLAGAESKPSLQAFQAAYADPEARRVLKEKVTVLHCTTEYPAPPESLNINTIPVMARAFGLDVGFSDHSEGFEAAIAARVLGATVLEKHITLDRSMVGPDHKASMEPAEFAAMVRQIRNLDVALGDGIKRMMAAESANKAIARKSPVAARPIAAGELFSEDNLTLKRTRGGVSATHYYDLIGRASPRSFDADEVIL